MRLLSLVSAAVISLLSFGAMAASDTGTAVGVNPAASARDNSGERTLRVGSDVAVGQTVVTDRRGQVQILFPDETRLVVGPGSSLLIEKYLLRGNQTADKFAINALSGTFRFITGRSAKAAYEIRTPSATIGVRGTAFDFTVDRLQLTTLVLFHGSVQLCTLGGRCIVLDTQCQVGAADLVQSVQLAATASLRSVFPYVRSQRPLLVDFRVPQAEGCLSSPRANTPPSLSTPNSGGSLPTTPATPPTGTPTTTPTGSPTTTPPPTTTPCTTRVC